MSVKIPISHDEAIKYYKLSLRDIKAVGISKLVKVTPDTEDILDGLVYPAMMRKHEDDPQLLAISDCVAILDHDPTIRQKWEELAQLIDIL